MNRATRRLILPGHHQPATKDHTMTLRLTAPFVLIAALLSACSDRNPHNDPGPVCDQQSAMAQSGKVGGGDIIITCP